MENRRKKPLFPPGEQPQIIFTAYRSIEDSFYSFEETKKWIWSLKYEDESVEHCVCKWILGKETPKDVLECKLRMVGGQLCTIDVYMDDYRGMMFFHDRCLPYSLPFSIGDLERNVAGMKGNGSGKGDCAGGSVQIGLEVI